MLNEHLCNTCGPRRDSGDVHTKGPSIRGGTLVPFSAEVVSVVPPASGVAIANSYSESNGSSAKCPEGEQKYSLKHRYTYQTTTAPNQPLPSDQFGVGPPPPPTSSASACRPSSVSDKISAGNQAREDAGRIVVGIGCMGECPRKTEKCSARVIKAIVSSQADGESAGGYTRYCYVESTVEVTYTCECRG